MQYIDTKPLTMHLLTNQREELTNLQKDMLNIYKVKIPISELVRQALKVGLPIIRENKEEILKLKRKKFVES
ncbi:MAG: hypothetical protein ACPK7O_06265 [Methanobacterium sp.]